MKIYSTKYALTKASKSTKPGSVVTVFVSVGQYNNYLDGEGREWHRTRESAVARAEVMRKAKIESLRKSLAKFEAMRFE